MLHVHLQCLQISLMGNFPMSINISKKLNETKNNDKQNSHMVLIFSCTSYSIFVRVNKALPRLQMLNTVRPPGGSLNLRH